MMAATAITRGSHDPEQAKQLVAAARNSLAAAGFGSDGSPWTGHPDQELAGSARLIAAVADVVDACLSGGQLRIDEAQAQAMPHVVDAARYMPVTQWLPLAQRVVLAPGTVLSAPVLVARNSVGYFHELFPTLRAYSQKKDVPSGFVFMTDTRVEQPAASAPVTSLVSFQDLLETKRKLADTATRPDCVVVSSEPEVLEPAAEHGAHFILHRGNQATKTEIANVVNWRACGFGLRGTVADLLDPVPPSCQVQLIRFSARSVWAPVQRRRRSRFERAPRSCSAPKRSPSRPTQAATGRTGSGLSGNWRRSVQR